MDRGVKRYKLRTKLTELFAPVGFRCIACGREVFDEVGFCDECRARLPFNNGKTCKKCGVRIDGEEDYCGNCVEGKMYFDRAYSVFDYDGVVRRAILRMKFGNCGSYARVLSRYLAYLANKLKLDFDIVTFVPMSKSSYKKRRYNQAELLARGFCDIMGIDDKFVATLVKVKDTSPQEKLNRAERKQNLIGCFRLADGVSVKGKSVLLIDDIKTTGSTVNECAKVLKLKGAAGVNVLTVASRPEYFVYESDYNLL